MTPAHGSAPAGNEASRGAEGIPSTSIQHTVRLLPVATAHRKDSKHWTPETISWDSVLHSTENPADRKECGNWLFGTLRGTRRTKDTIVSRSALQLDADHAQPPLWDAVAALGVAALAHTTYSSKPDALRMRVIIPLDRDVTPDEYRHIARVVMHRLGWGYWDPSSDQPERYMFRPAAPPGELLGAESYSGPMLDADELLAERLPAAEPAPRQSGAGAQGPDPVSAERYVLAAVPTVLAELDELAQLAPQQRNDRGQGWEDASGIYHRAARLVELSNLAPGAYPLDHAQRDYMAHAPRSYAHQAARKWDDAVAAVGDRPAPLPDAVPAPTEDLAPAVAAELQRMQVREEARRQFEQLRAPAPIPFDAGTLADHLRRPPPPAARVEGLIPWEASTAIIAQRKTGKTTFELNMAHSLLTGEPLLDSFEVRPVDGTVAILNFEVSGATLAGWAHDAGLPADRLFLVNLRGASNPFARPEEAARLAALLRSHEVESLIVDPFGRAFTGDNQNDAGQVQQWLLGLDQFARRDVGALDVVLAVHSGWNGERARGSSALEDWADSLIYLNREKDDNGDARFIRADGRDVDLDEDQLLFNPDTRRLSLSGTGSRTAGRAARKVDQLIPGVVEIVVERPGITTGKLEDAMRSVGHSFQKGDVGKAARAAVEQGLLQLRSGARGAVHYEPPQAHPPQTNPPRGTPDA